MGIFYVLTVIAMLVTFVLFKKSDKKQNLINMCILSAICYLAFNILICMSFGVLNITTNLLSISLGSNVLLYQPDGTCVVKNILSANPQDKQVGLNNM